MGVIIENLLTNLLLAEGEVSYTECLHPKTRQNVALPVHKKACPLYSRS